jgi:hypothetical protein
MQDSLPLFLSRILRLRRLVFLLVRSRSIARRVIADGSTDGGSRSYDYRSYESCAVASAVRFKGYLPARHSTYLDQTTLLAVHPNVSALSRADLSSPSADGRIVSPRHLCMLDECQGDANSVSMKSIRIVGIDDLRRHYLRGRVYSIHHVLQIVIPHNSTNTVKQFGIKIAQGQIPRRQDCRVRIEWGRSHRDASGRQRSIRYPYSTKERMGDDMRNLW